MNIGVGHKSKYIICITISKSVTNLSSQMDANIKGDVFLKLMNTHTHTHTHPQYCDLERSRKEISSEVILQTFLYYTVLNALSTVASSCGGESFSLGFPENALK
jgi:hypothetical protein